MRCNCGAERVIGLEAMARDRRYVNLTVAHVALRLDCSGCKDGPDEVHLAATPHGLHAPPGNGGIIWTMPLVTRERHDGGRRMRFIPGVVDSPMIDVRPNREPRERRLLDARQAPPGWIWIARCDACRHMAGLPIEALIRRHGELRTLENACRSLRCAACGHRGATSAMMRLCEPGCSGQRG